MRNSYGGPGTITSLILRVGQFVCAVAYIWLIAIGYPYSEFSYLITSMGIHAAWSFTLACLDMYALLKKKDIKCVTLLTMYVIGDWLNAFLSLAAASSSGGVVILHARDTGLCANTKLNLPCGRYELAVSMAFMTWLFTQISALVMLWVLPSALV